MQQHLFLQPIHSSSAGILHSFLEGKNLSTDQTHFLEWHQKQLSNAFYDPILNYYLRSQQHKQHDYHGVFLLPHEAMNLDAIQLLKKRIQASLKNYHSAIISVTQQQFLDFREYTIQDLIFWHGNQYLTGAPFFPGGIPPVIYFQWGNTFGIVKYVILADEKDLKANVLIYFEDMQERNLDECVADYEKTLKMELDAQQTLLNENKIETPSLHHFIIKPPALTLDPVTHLDSSD